MGKDKINFTNCDAVIKDFEKYEGAGIYSLVDEDGKRYIGKSTNVYKRLITHRRALNHVYLYGELGYIYEGSKLAQAVIDGHTFHVEILSKIPWYEATRNELIRQEEKYLNMFGGIDNTYNSAYTGIAYTWLPDWEEIIELGINLERELYEHVAKHSDPNEYIKMLIRDDIKSGK